MGQGGALCRREGICVDERDLSKRWGERERGDGGVTMGWWRGRRGLRRDGGFMWRGEGEERGGDGDKRMRGDE